MAIKPAGIGPALDGIRSFITKDHVVISIAAGMKLSFLDGTSARDKGRSRVRPSQPCMVGRNGFGILPRESKEDPEDQRSVQEIFSSVGMAFCVDEKLLDAVTGLSGSGPAYVYLVIESMAEGGVLAGLPRDMSIKLRRKLYQVPQRPSETNGHPAQLKDTVHISSWDNDRGVKVPGGRWGARFFHKGGRSCIKTVIELGKN